MHWFLLLCNITLVNLILSGDNALAISMAASQVPEAHRRTAIVVGSAVAILLLIGFLAAGSYLIDLPLLKSVAGLALLWIAVRLAMDRIRPSTVAAAAESQRWTSLRRAIGVIVAADLTMELDNAMAMLGVAGGRIGLLMASLLITIPFLIFGSHVIAAVLHRVGWLVFIAAAYITWIAGNLIADDPLYHSTPWADTLQWLAPALCLAAYALMLMTALRKMRTASHSPGR
ncbi:YjbE family putative metal transport protein [Alicyclobacillus contaminans]|uniref:YjbE family putative metal transport protein n=1 Tax=Alicyclobacillus contaminans TaxID=392016 RepID=UPI000420B9EC|nr:YjbE family putative metal transport protein [Alicyclobacillus contaminans]